MQRIVRHFIPSVAILGVILLGIDAAAGPSTQNTVDSILDFSHQPAASQPASRPSSPLQSKDATDTGRLGTITLSDGGTVIGHIATTPEKPIRVWVEKEKQYEDFPLEQVASAQVKVVWERDEKEWNFKETGSDVKVYSGRTYPARQTQYTFTLTDGSIIEGDVVAPLYITTDDGKSQTRVLYKRDKGEIGSTLAKLIYVRSVTFK